MRAYLAFTRKEFTEYLRTAKLFIMVVVFLVFGLMNPVIAKVTPELLKTALPPGFTVEIPTPTALDSWAQFFKNVGQMGLLVLLIVFSGIMANEFSRGTLINMLTKGLPRRTVILSKLTMAALIWAISYLLCFAVSYFYTAYFWPMAGLHHVFLTFFSLWLYGILLITLVIFGGVLFKNIYGSLLLAGGAMVLMSLLNLFPQLRRYNPNLLSSGNLALLTGQKTVSDFAPALIICAALIFALVIISVAVFNKEQV